MYTTWIRPAEEKLFWQSGVESVKQAAPLEIHKTVDLNATALKVAKIILILLNLIFISMPPYQYAIYLCKEYVMFLCFQT